MISFGVDELIRRDPSWKSLNLGLVTNHAATTGEGRPVREALISKGFKVKILFAPEHGLYAAGADGAFMEDAVDELTKLPVVSLYGNKLAPDTDDLKQLDVLLFDIPDIGTRFYTYLWTMTHVMEACAKTSKPLIILDRPNPLSGLFDLAEGPGLNETYCSSFIGRWDIPLRHSCTTGELAVYFNNKKGIRADLEIIKCRGWQRNMFHPGWGLAFIPASPAMKDFTTAIMYPGTGLLEATNVSEGRGTSLPFVAIGAPWIDHYMLIEKLENKLTGVNIRAVEFTPKESKYKEQLCRGIQFKISEIDQLKPVFNGLLLIKYIKDLFPENFQWKTYPTNANPGGKDHLDKLLGVPQSESLFDLDVPAFITKINEISSLNHWELQMNDYLLY